MMTLFETMKRYTFLSAEEAVNNGLADEVVTKKELDEKIA